MHNFLVRLHGHRKFIPIMAQRRIEAKLKFIRLEKGKLLINAPVKNVNKTRLIFRGGLK